MFREPEVRPSKTVSMAFTALVLLPIAILLICVSIKFMANDFQTKYFGHVKVLVYFTISVLYTNIDLKLPEKITD